jgi:hypothetical protein
VTLLDDVGGPPPLPGGVLKDRSLVARGPDIDSMMRMAVERGPEGVAVLRELVTLHREQQQYNAALEFNEALSRFQDECPPVPRSSVAGFATRGGSRVEYKYAGLEEILTTTRETLRRNGFSLAFDTSVDGSLMRVTGILRHVNGHSESSSFAVPTASANPGMSEQQKFAGALTFAKRSVIISLLGLIVSDPTDEEDAHAITESQAANLSALIDETGTDLGRFLKWANAESVDQIRASRYEDAVRFLERKRKA